MPCDCEFDMERRCVRARAWGVVTYADAMANRKKFMSDPRFRPDFCQLYDGREITKLALTASEIGQLAMDTVFGPGTRRAFVTPTSETYSLMRLYQIYRAVNAGKEQIKLFRTLEEAEAWLWSA
jgi:hypothetical protein